MLEASVGSTLGVDRSPKRSIHRRLSGVLTLGERQQKWRQLVVVDPGGLALLVEAHETGQDLGHLLSDQAVLTPPLALVAVGDRPQAKQAGGGDERLYVGLERGGARG